MSMQNSGKRSHASRVVAIAVAVSVLAIGPAAARQPISGVSCEGGFFVRMGDGRVFWIHGEPERKELVYSGTSKLIAMAMCDAGVLTVFEDEDTSAMNRAFYSPNCRNIGDGEGQSVAVAARPTQIRRIAHTDDGVTLHFANGEKVENDICTRRTMD
jgi:hypothetical protein